VKFDIGVFYANRYEKTEYILLSPATLNRHKSAVFEWNGIRLLGQQRYIY